MSRQGSKFPGKAMITIQRTVEVRIHQIQNAQKLQRLR